MLIIIIIIIIIKSEIQDQLSVMRIVILLWQQFSLQVSFLHE